MNFRISSVFILGLMVAANLSLRADDNTLKSDYYPLKVGTTWQCKTMGQSVSMRVAKHEMYDGKMCALIESVVNENVVAAEHISVGKDGVYRHSIAGMKAEPAVKILTLNPKNGDNWKQDFKINGQEGKIDCKVTMEDVTVAAGTYKSAALVTTEMEVMGQKVQAKVWYAKGVGMVRTKLEVGGNEIDIELEKFTEGK
jgi:hypothetical protein